MACRALTLFDKLCSCGLAPVEKAGKCLACYRRDWRDRTLFGGHREEVLARDRHCRVCTSTLKIIVHHREHKTEDAKKMAAVCRRCHPRIHFLKNLRTWEEPELVELWREQHPGRPLQLQFEFEPETRLFLIAAA